MGKLDWGRARRAERGARDYRDAAFDQRRLVARGQSVEVAERVVSVRKPRSTNSGFAACACLTCGRRGATVTICHGLLADGCPNVKFYCGNVCATAGGYPWAGRGR